MFAQVESVDATGEKFVDAGGSVLQPRTVIPGVSYVVACRDSEGNPFAVLQADETAGF